MQHSTVAVLSELRESLQTEAGSSSGNKVLRERNVLLAGYQRTATRRGFRLARSRYTGNEETRYLKVVEVDLNCHENSARCLSLHKH